MRYRTLIAFTAVVALGCIPVTSGAFAAERTGGHGGGGHAAHATGGRAMTGHAMAGHAMAGRAYVGGGHRYAGGRHFRRGYGGAYYGGDYGYGCDGYYDYNGCGYDPGAAIVGGLIGGALNAAGVY